MLVGLFALLSVTMPDVWWPAEAKPDRLIVQVSTRQFSWRFQSAAVPTRRQIEFVLTSTDVNHGFVLSSSAAWPTTR